MSVGIDGVDGAGKTHLADELAVVLTVRGIVTVRASVDGFHRPAAERHRRGRHSPEGFFLDSYDYDAMRRLLFEPLRPGGDRRGVLAIHDVDRDAAVDAPIEVVADPAVLLVDGIFLHRDELVDFWDLSVWLDVPFEVSVPRGASRGYGDPDPRSPANHRYVEGQRLYLRTCRPHERATFVVDNTDLDAPRLVRPASD
ncbi:MAG TPA: hypothetical protein VK906_15810 [Egicoccus sp.]|nr:hypothetical protein [Egicoccus sp.]HSK24652.1 hypothetical protein [Egicoccus sp.]